jgi:UDP-glucose 4-epimerase
MSRILVTGGAGFIGAAVVRALGDRGDAVVVLDSGVAVGFGLLEGTDAEIVRADIRDLEAVRRAVEGCDAIVHLAAQASVPESIAHPLEDAAVNIDGSLGLLEAARGADVARFVFASSNAVIGGHPPPANEGLVPFPVSPYGAAKAALEAYLRAYQEAYGLAGVSLRFANAYGPGSAHKSSVAAAFIKAYLRGGPLTIRGTGDQTRDYVFVSDIAAAVLACVDAPTSAIAGEVFQVGTGVETSLSELADCLFEVGDGSVPISYEPPSPGDVARNVSDIAHAREALGWAPVVPLREGLTRTLDWFRANWS